MRVLELGHPEVVRFVAYGRTGRKLVAATATHFLIWNLETFEPEVHYSRLRVIPERPCLGVLDCLAFSGGAKFLHTSGYWPADQELPRIEGLGTEEARRVAELSTRPGLLCFGPDGQSIFRETHSIPYRSPQRLALWNLAGECVQPYPMAGLLRPTLATFSSDGTKLALVPASARISLLDAASGEVVTELEHTNEVFAVAFSADGRRLATTAGKIVRLWSVPEGDCLFRFRAFRSYSRCLAFSADGRLLVAGSTEGRVRVWEVETGRELSDHNWDQGFVQSVAFAPDGLTAAVGCRNAAVVIWDVDV